MPTYTYSAYDFKYSSIIHWQVQWLLPPKWKIIKKTQCTCGPGSEDWGSSRDSVMWWGRQEVDHGERRTALAWARWWERAVPSVTGSGGMSVPAAGACTRERVSELCVDVKVAQHHTKPKKYGWCDTTQGNNTLFLLSFLFLSLSIHLFLHKRKWFINFTLVYWPRWRTCWTWLFWGIFGEEEV